MKKKKERNRSQIKNNRFREEKKGRFQSQIMPNPTHKLEKKDTVHDENISLPLNYGYKLNANLHVW